MKNYKEPIVQILLCEEQDIVTTSGGEALESGNFTENVLPFAPFGTN